MVTPTEITAAVAIVYLALVIVVMLVMAFATTDSEVHSPLRRDDDDAENAG